MPKRPPFKFYNSNKIVGNDCHNKNPLISLCNKQIYSKYTIARHLNKKLPCDKNRGKNILK